MTLALGALGAALTGCGETRVACNAACIRAVPITVRVVDAADGGAISGAEVNGAPCPAPACEVRQPDGGPLAGAGTYTLEVTAPGYVPSQRMVTVPGSSSGGCCDPGFLPQQLEVPLQSL